jgi:hypothetical protein
MMDDGPLEHGGGTVLGFGAACLVGVNTNFVSPPGNPIWGTSVRHERA